MLTSTEQNELHTLLRQQGKLTQNDCWDVIEVFNEFLLAQPEREPMTGKEISQGFRADKDATNAESYWAGVALAEKHHKIGGGE